ncbi:11847_t:CDS:1, partial [Dentiscutata erythropus]
MEQLELVTKSDHKIIQLKIKKTWQIHLDREVQDNIGSKYNIKLMCDEKWMKFTTHVEKKLKTTTISSRKEKYGITVNSLNKNWKTLKNIIIEAADCAIPKKKIKKFNKKINKEFTKNYKRAKSFNKLYQFIKKERTKSVKYIKSHDKFLKEKKKLSVLNIEIEKILINNRKYEELLYKFKEQSIRFQTIARVEKKKENFKKIQKTIEKRWENLKESPKKMINSILDKPRKSIIMDRLIVESESNSTTKIITDEAEIKTVVQKHFQNWTRKRNTNETMMKEWEKWYKPISTIDSNNYKNLLIEVSIDELEETICLLPNKKVTGQLGLQYE